MLGYTYYSQVARSDLGYTYYGQVACAKALDCLVNHVEARHSKYSLCTYTYLCESRGGAP